VRPGSGPRTRSRTPRSGARRIDHQGRVGIRSRDAQRPCSRLHSAARDRAAARGRSSRTGLPIPFRRLRLLSSGRRRRGAQPGPGRPGTFSCYPAGARRRGPHLETCRVDPAASLRAAGPLPPRGSRGAISSTSSPAPAALGVRGLGKRGMAGGWRRWGRGQSSTAPHRRERELPLAMNAPSAVE